MSASKHWNKKIKHHDDMLIDRTEYHAKGLITDKRFAADKKYIETGFRVRDELREFENSILELLSR